MDKTAMTSAITALARDARALTSYLQRHWPEIGELPSVAGTARLAEATLAAVAGDEREGRSSEIYRARRALASSAIAHLTDAELNVAAADPGRLAAAVRLCAGVPTSFLSAPEMRAAVEGESFARLRHEVEAAAVALDEEVRA